MLKVTLLWPANIETVAGAVASLMALEVRVITNVLVGGTATETFAVVAGLAPLITTLLAMFTFKDGPLTSWTVSN